MDVVYLDINKAFDPLSQRLFITDMLRYMVDKWIIKWVENQLDCQAQRAVISGTKSSW